jgi:hypothetical protein
MSPTLDIPNSRAPRDTSLTARPLDIVGAVVVIAVVSNPVPVAGVITVEAGMVTRRSHTGLKVMSEPLLTVTEAAAVTLPDIVATPVSVAAVTIVVTSPTVESAPVASLLGASAA